MIEGNVTSRVGKQNCLEKGLENMGGYLLEIPYKIYRSEITVSTERMSDRSYNSKVDYGSLRELSIPFEVLQSDVISVQTINETALRTDLTKSLVTTTLKKSVYIPRWKFLESLGFKPIF